MKRTTVRLDDRLMKQAKRFALDTDRTFTRFVEDAIRQAMARPPRRRRKFKLPTFAPPRGKEGLMPGINLDDNSAVQELMDLEDAARGKFR